MNNSPNAVDRAHPIPDMGETSCRCRADRRIAYSAAKDREMKPEEENSDMLKGRERGVVGSALQLWARWKRIAHKIGDFQARVLMTVFYFVILGPVALVLRWRSDPLAIKPGTRKGWSHQEVRDGPPMVQARRQC